MHNFDYTSQGRRPTAAQIVKAWRDARKPKIFSVSYGETYAEFEYSSSWGPARWQDSGNGCCGVQRNKVVEALDIATHDGGRAGYGV